MTEDEKIWKAVTDTVVPLGSPGGKRKSSRATVIQSPRELDLHGLTVQQAYQACRNFIEDTPYKRVLIITGRSGQIRFEFEKWLETLHRVKRWHPLNEGSFEVEIAK